MNIDLVTFKTAILAKEKGFNWTTDYNYLTTEISSYIREGTLTENINYLTNADGDANGFFSAPTQCELQKWLRDVHNIMVYIDYRHGITPYYVILTEDNTIIGDSEDSYEEALEAGLYRALKLIKNQT